MNGVCFMRRGHPQLTLGCAIIVRRTARQIIHCLNEHIIPPPISDFVTSFFWSLNKIINGKITTKQTGRPPQPSTNHKTPHTQRPAKQYNNSTNNSVLCLLGCSLNSHTKASQTPHTQSPAKYNNSTTQHTNTILLYLLGLLTEYHDNNNMLSAQCN